MPGRGRRIAVGFLILAGLLVGGRWAAGFLAERLWEASVSQAAGIAGMRRAVLGAGLEFAVILVTAGWFLLHFTLAARIGLPTRAPPGEERSRTWPRAIPRWSVPVAALVLGLLLGTGGSGSLHALQLMLDGVPVGIRDPLLEEDLGVFLGSYPFWSAMQERAVLLSAVVLAGALLLYVAGGLIRKSGRRIRVSPRARGHVAVLLAVLALTLAWEATFEPLRLASGLRGPVRQVDFLLHAMMAWLEAGIGAVTAVVSLLWWLRIRGPVVLLFWVMFGLARFDDAVLPLHPDLASADPAWRNDSRRLDSVAYGLPPPQTDSGWPDPPPPAGLVPTLWDDSVVVRAGLGVFAHRGWIPPPEESGRAPAPAWIGFRSDGHRTLLLAMSDNTVGEAGAPLFWSAGSAAPAPGLRSYRVSAEGPVSVRPGAPRIELGDSVAGGPAAASLGRRIMLAWAWQFPRLLTAAPGTRIGWRLDPLVRLRSLAPFAHWTSPRIRWVDSRLVWQSDGQLVADRFPSSTRVSWGIGSASLVHSAFVGMVDAEAGQVRLFQRDAGDSLAAAWARISAPLIEPPSAIPPALRTGESYPSELALAQARVLAGPAWGAGTLELERSSAISTESPGGSERLISFLRPGTQVVASLLLLRRTPAGDSVRLIALDSLIPIESAGALRQRWERFPFQQMLRDSILAAGAAFRTGAVRYALTSEGPIAYQPGWAEGPAARPRLALVNVALGSSLGTGRRLDDALQNLRGEISPVPVGSGSEAILDEVRRWWQRADSAFQRGDLPALGRALSRLRELLERQP